MLDLHDPASYDEPNWAEHLDDETLTEIGLELCEDVELDAASREGWLEETEMWLNMAAQVIEEKTTPWEGASNVKFPLLTTAALQFHARAQEELFRSDRVLKGKPVGRDPDGQKAARGRRVESAMSTQLLYEMEDWQDDTDRLLFVLPLVGTMFRKTYWSALLDRPVSELILPSELIVNFWATDWERCRKTHSFPKTRNEIIELQRLGEYRDVDIPMEADEPTSESEDDKGELPGDADPNYTAKDVPFTIYETHSWWDLDDDGYAEPYIVTVLKDTQTVLSIKPRFTTDHIQTNLDDQIACIKPIEYVLGYKFLPDVDSSVYGSGLGKLIGPSNAAIDSIINQLMDSGTMATMPSGFYGRGVRLMRGGDVRFQPGEWQQVNSTGEDLQKNFWPLPVKEPSAVLFNLLGMLIQAGERIGAVTQSLGGQNPGQNQAHSTTEDVMEQGLKVFLGIYKRLYRSLTKEFRMLYQLNYLYLTPEAYDELVDFEPPAPQPGEQGQPQQPPQPPPSPEVDFSPVGLDIIPEADPQLANSFRKQRRIRSLIEAKRAGMPLNDDYIMRTFLESIDDPDPAAAMAKEPPKKSDKEMELEVRREELEFKYKELQIESEFRVNEPIQDIARAMEHMAKARSLDAQADFSQMEAQLQEMMEQAKAQREERKAALDLHFQQQRYAMEAKAQAIRNAQDAAAGRDKLEQQRELGDIKVKTANEIADTKLREARSRSQGDTGGS